jgi:Xaa-Pro aminopeptidase
MLRQVRAGASADDLIGAAAALLPPYNFHPMISGAIGNSIGLSFEESPVLGRDENAKLEEGCVYTLRCGAMGEGSDNAIASAMVAVNKTGVEVLWPATERPGR